MTNLLLTILAGLDMALIATIYFLNRRQGEQGDVISTLMEERKVLEEIRQSVQQDLEVVQKKSRETISRVTHLATEAEQEVKAGGASLATEMRSLIPELTARVEAPLQELARAQSQVETMLRRVQSQHELLQKLVIRGEKICKFFDKRIPYEDVLEEIEDKKYVDARALIAKGMNPEQVSRELGIPVHEVRLIAGFAASA